MISYIAFLRAINVGGHNVTMEKLRGLFADMGFANVRTYIQTGNVFFDSPEKDRAVLTQKIEAYLQEQLGYEVATMLTTAEEVEKAISLDPFAKTEVTPLVRLCAIFISAPLPEDLQLPHVSAKGEVEILAVTPNLIFAVMHQQEGRPGNIGAYIEKTFKIKATVRFWATLAKIIEAAKVS